MVQDEKYINLTDEEVIQYIRSGETNGVDYLLEKYKNIVRQKARSLFLIDGDKDDLIQEGMIGLFKAVRDYNREKDNSFYSFANLCVSRQIYSAIKASNRKKNLPLNTYISLYSPAYKEDQESDDQSVLADIVYLQNDLNPEELVIDKENTSMIEYELESRLSEFEKKVLSLYLEGVKYIEIAKILKKEPKSIDNALQRIKGKLNKVLKIV